MRLRACALLRESLTDPPWESPSECRSRLKGLSVAIDNLEVLAQGLWHRTSVTKGSLGSGEAAIALAAEREMAFMSLMMLNA
jgi:hypothetical protein